MKAAAFGRLCVETRPVTVTDTSPRQPPSGGCVLKRLPTVKTIKPSAQPPSGGCVLKHLGGDQIYFLALQPPSGGCVLKHFKDQDYLIYTPAAAFGRLCVET